jgi:paraquat-inducible protein B
VNGLRTGAPVKFKGVEIGTVKDVRLQVERDMAFDRIPVIIEVDLQKMISRGGTVEIAERPEAFRDAIVHRGLRGQLLMESLVTGLLYVGLDFFPGTPLNLAQQADGRYKYQEIPVTPTVFEQAQDAVSQVISKLEETDFKALAQSLERTVTGVNNLVNSPELQLILKRAAQTLPKIDETITAARKAVDTIDGSVASLGDNFAQTSDAARQMLQQAELTLKSADGALQSAEAAMINIGSISDPDSATFYQLAASLREVSTAARSLRMLANSIERNPRALLFGKPETPEAR